MRRSNLGDSELPLLKAAPLVLAGSLSPDLNLNRATLQN